MIKRRSYRIALAVTCLFGLLFTFLFQRISFVHYLHIGGSQTVQFIVNRTIRFVINDVFAIGLVYAIFPLRKYMIFSIFVQVAGMMFFLFPYFLLKILLPDYNGPLINFLHRLILNPVLVLLLIPAFYFQNRTFDNNTRR